MKYYKDFTKLKGQIDLTKNTKVLKTARNQIEIPLLNKTYVLVEPEHPKKGVSPSHDAHSLENNITSIDEWLDSIDRVIKILP